MCRLDTSLGLGAATASTEHPREQTSATQHPHPTRVHLQNQRTSVNNLTDLNYEHTPTVCLFTVFIQQ